MKISFLREYWLLLLLAFPFFIALDDSSLWDSNEAFYAQAPREMLQQGNWATPSFNGKPRLNKPPLSYWVVIPFYSLFSPSIFWERFPMALLAYGSVLAVFFKGKILYDRQVALWAAGIFATTFRFLILSRRLLIDVLLLFCLLWAIAFFLSWIESQKKHHFLLACLFLGLGFLAKGPVAFLPLFFCGLYLWLSGQMGQLRQAPWLAGGIIYLFLCSFWFAYLAVSAGWQPVQEFFLSDNLGRFVSEDFGPRRSIFYYVGVFFGDFFPWSFFFPAAAIWTLRRKDEESHWLMLSLWMATFFLFFSLSYNKQEYYILPLYPAAALWVAHYFKRARPPALLVGTVGTLLVILALALFWIAQVLFEQSWLWIPLLCLPPLVGGLASRRYSLTLASLALFYFTSFALYLTPLDEYQPAYHFAQKIQQRASQQEQFQAGYYKYAAPSLAFYLDQPIFELGDLQAAVKLLESEDTIYMIVSAQDYPELEQATTQPLQIVQERPKLYTTGRTLIEGFRRDRSDDLRESWTRPVYLITNRGDL